MAVVPLTKLISGMVLAANVVNGDGRVLIPAGTQLTESLIELMTAHNVECAQVLQTAVSFSERLKHLFPEARFGAQDPETKIGFLFAHNDPLHPLIQNLTNYKRAQLAKIAALYPGDTT